MARAYESPMSTGVSYTAIPLTKSDSTEYDPPFRMVDVIDGGSITFIDGQGVSRTLAGLPAGYSLRCLVKKVMSTGTSGTNFVGYP